MSIVDTAYNDVLDGLDDEPAPPREVGLEPIQRFDFYHIKVVGATTGQTQAGVPFVRPVVEVLAGPDGTVGRFVADDLYLGVKKTIKETNEDGESTERPKSAEEYAQGVGRVRKSLRRLGEAFALPSSAPASVDEGTLQAWAATLVGREAISAIRIEKARGNFPAKNRIVWMSLCAPTDAPKNANGGLTSALDEAKQHIERFNSKQRSKSLGRTVGGLRAKPGQMQ